MTVTRIAGRAAATILAALGASSGGWSQDARPPDFRNGRVCWDSLCIGRPASNPQKPLSAQKRMQAPTASQQAAPKQAPAASGWTSSKAPLPPKSGNGVATTAGFYKYPIIYRAEAPPLMPPGAADQPYVQITKGVWYWPGADSIKIPLVRGFDP